MENTKIDWCDSSFNPITGCYHKCPYCYARGITNRFVSRRGCELIEPETYHLKTEDGKELIEINERPYFKDTDGNTYGCAYPHGFVPTIHRYRFGEYADKKRPRNIFVGSMADIFGDWVPERWIQEVMNSCEKGPQHNYLFLTKNPKRYIELARFGVLQKGDNFWYGTTVTNGDMPIFYSNEVHTFLSVEPLLEDMGTLGMEILPEWIIIGAETGNRKHKITPRREWIENIVTQCKECDIPVFMKESLRDIWGEELLREFPKQLLHE